MPDENNQEQTPESLGGEGTTSVAYATPIQRIWALVGAVYMVIITLLITYGIATARFMTGIGGLMIQPALYGGAATITYLWRSQPERHTPGRAVLCILLLLVCAALAVLGIVDGVDGLLSNFGG